jgi:murein DD-endopeptidase MepM/ murein hydrolase activator NlpD
MQKTMSDYKQITFSQVRRRRSKKTSVSTSLFSVLDIFNLIKRKVVSRMFWGRSNYYKNIVHIIIFSITLVVAITGALYKFQFATQAQTSFQVSASAVGQKDLLEQGGSIETVLVTDPEAGGLLTFKHTVNPGETLDSIAEQYGVTKDTIRWASSDVVSPFTDKIEPGWKLTIPSLNGVLYTVKRGQSLDQIITETSVNNTEANHFNIVEFNNLTPPYNLEEGQKLFIPDGNLKSADVAGGIDIPVGVFADPLSDSQCRGYTYSRGFAYYHDGVDLAHWPGCPISAVANGVVTIAGWQSAGQGYMVEIDHGGGIVTKYFHGSGEYYVKKGDRVSQGQPIMMMGTTGYSTGVHLHFSLWKDGIAVDPAPYVPYHY